jgi:hypothetical protein
VIKHPFRQFQYLMVPLSVLPEVAHQAARETARLVLNAASALGRRLSD